VITKIYNLLSSSEKIGTNLDKFQQTTNKSTLLLKIGASDLSIECPIEEQVRLLLVDRNDEEGERVIGLEWEQLGAGRRAVGPTHTSGGCTRFGAPR
jgi:hypothetical protein